MTTTATTRPRLETRLARSVWRAWIPPARPSHREWIPANIRMPAGTETAGDPFDLDFFPHVAGVLDAADNPMTKLILLPWCVRAGKTLTMLCVTISLASQAPRPMQIARESEEKTVDLIGNQLIPLLEACPAMRDQLPPPHRRNPKRGLQLANCRIRASWSGSPGTMRGFPSAYNFGSEISAWSGRESGDGDPVFLFMKRALLFEDEQLNIMESTPAAIDRCKMTMLCDLDGVDVRRFLVPCPRCGTWQPLIFGTPDPDSPGLKWSKSGGHSTPAEAEKTAYYRCESGCRIEESDRVPMTRAGRWISEGQTLTKAGKLRGKAKHPDASTISFGHPNPGDNPQLAPFSQLYALRVPWGAVAREWCEKKGTSSGRREVWNQTLGLTWDPAPVTVKPTELAGRLGEDIDLGIVPDWARFLTLGVDVGRSGEDYHFFWAVCAWGLHARGHLVDYGVTWTDKELRQLLKFMRYQTEAADRSLAPLQIAIDSGNFTQFVYELCNSMPGHVYPIKGSSHSTKEDFIRGVEGPDMFSEGAQMAGLSDGQKKARRKQGRKDLIIPHTHQTQRWISDRCEGAIKRDNPAWFSVPRVALELQPVPEVDLPSHLLGDFQDGRHWIKRYERQDIRDAIRYARVMAERVTRRGTAWNRLPVAQMGSSKQLGSSANRITGIAGRPRLKPGKDSDG